MMRSPHSPLLAGAGAKRASARSENFFVEAEIRGFLALEIAAEGETAAEVGLDCLGIPPSDALADKPVYAKITAHANPTLTISPLWQNTFRESIVETA